MKKCKYEKCKKDFEPLKPKAIYCSAKCRVYGNRLIKKGNPSSAIKDEGIDTKKHKQKRTSTDSTKKIIGAKSNAVENVTKPPIPTRMEGELYLDFAQRKNEWKRLYN